MIAFVAQQIGASPSTFADYARRDQTRREHTVELQKVLGVRSFRLEDWRSCLQVGANAAWATDRGEPIMQAMLAHLRAERVLVLRLRRCWSELVWPRGYGLASEYSRPWRRG